MLKSIVLGFTVLSVLFASSALASAPGTGGVSGFVNPFGDTTKTLGTCPFNKEKPAGYGTGSAQRRRDEKAVVGGIR